MTTTRALWLCRAMPFPLDTGDRIYSARLMQAVAGAGVELTVAGFECGVEGAALPAASMHWRPVPGGPRGTLRSLLSVQPLVAAAHATPAYRRHVQALAREHWDFVVFDHYAMGWAVPYFAGHGDAGPLRVHVAHDHEASVYASLVRGFRGPALKRLGLWQNMLKTARAERRLARAVDLVTAITPDDAARFAADAPATARVVLTPGYGGAVSARGRIDAGLPRQVVMVGNYRWVAKGENLRQFVRAADAAFHAHGITLHVIGSMDDELARELRRGTRATVLHGFVADVAPQLAQARLAAVPELIGGGFKLKYLDYIFGRVPVATLEQATAGLPGEIRRCMLCAADMDGLVRQIVQHIDDTERLQAMQAGALQAAQSLYRWEDRGHRLLEALRELQGERGRRAKPQPAAPAGVAS